MSDIVKLGRTRTGEIAEKLARGEVLSLHFYNRRIGFIVPASHQAATSGREEAFHRAVMGIAAELYTGAENEVAMLRVNIMVLAQDLLRKFGDDNEEIA